MGCEDLSILWIQLQNLRIFLAGALQIVLCQCVSRTLVVLLNGGGSALCNHTSGTKPDQDNSVCNDRAKHSF